MKRAEIEKLVDDFIQDELKAIMIYAFGNFSGGTRLEDADAHFEQGCDHLAIMRPKMVEIIARKFTEVEVSQLGEGITCKP